MTNDSSPLIGRMCRLARYVLVGLLKGRIIGSGRLSEISENRGYWFEQLGAASEELICHDPQHLSKADIPDQIQEINRPFKFSPAFVCELPQVKLMGPPALVFLGASPVLESAVARLDCMERSIDLSIDGDQAGDLPRHMQDRRQRPWLGAFLRCRGRRSAHRSDQNGQPQRESRQLNRHGRTPTARSITMGIDRYRANVRIDSHRRI